MSAEVLREAARLMRERAEAATGSAWVVDIEDDDGVIAIRANRGAGPTVAVTVPLGYEQRRDNATHIATWHPAVALAVADWLDFTARGLELAYEYGGGVPGADDHALTLARIYLTTTPHKEHTS